MSRPVQGLLSSVYLDVVTNRRMVKSLSSIEPGPEAVYSLSVGRKSVVTVSGFDYRPNCLKMCHVCHVFSENILGYSMGLECSKLGVFLALLSPQVPERTLQAEG
jgi:hypothetical protein